MFDQLSQVLDVQELATQAVEYMPKVLAALGILVVFRILYALTGTPLRKLLEKSGVHETLIRMIVDNVFRYTVYVFGFVMAADQLGINVAAALAGIGVAGIAVGFAAQDTVANVISGFLIFMDKPFEVGDWVSVADEDGEVREITMRTTRLRTLNNTYVIIPNKKIIDEVLVNHSKHGATRIDVPVGIAYKEYIPEAREVILKAIGDVQGVMKDPAPAVVVSGLGGSSVDLEIRVWIEDASKEVITSARVIEASKLALDEADIEIPFPHLQLFFDDVRPPVWEGLKQLRSGQEDEAA